ncbi:MAG: hypothetical protein HYR63_24590 [Proteobacteria bacterium]|nr:hypothetical protein [Pseudomonadota bacterium]
MSDMFSAAVDNHRAGRLANADLGYRRVLAAMPSHAGAMIMRGLHHADLDRDADGLTMLQRVLVAEPQHADCLANCAFVLVKLGRFDRAIRAGHAALAVAPSLVAGSINLATALLRKGYYPAAAAWLIRAGAVRPGQPQALANLGAIHLAAHQWAAAEQEFSRLLAVDPANQTALQQIALALHHQGKTDDEIAVLERLLERNSDQPEAHFALRVALRARGLPEGRRGRQSELARRHAALARQHEAKGLLLQAVEEYGRAIAFAPEEAALHEALERLVRIGLDGLEHTEMPEESRTGAWFACSLARALAAYRRAVLSPPPHAAARPRLYDYFTFFNEFELLDIRLAELADHVDGFVLVEAGWTNRGDPKPLFFEENKHRYEAYADKIRHIVLTEKRSAIAAQQFVHQKNYGLDALASCADWDLVVVADVDEIPRPAALQRYREQYAGRWDVARLSMELYQYFLNARTFRRWNGAAILPCGLARLVTPMGAQIIAGQPNLGLTVADAGWHFTWMGGVERVLTKLKSFGHKELDTPAVNNAAVIEARLARRENAIDQTGAFTGHFGTLELVDVDDRFPRALREREAQLRAAKFLAAR